jgi:molybdopterin molybdotransferase
MTMAQHMLSVAEARARILEHFEPLGSETVGLEEAGRRVLAEDVVATLSLPPFDNSSMDGYAVRLSEVQAASAEHPVAMPVSGDIPAGSGLPPALAPGTVARIMTGAPVPAGADAVVPVEDTDDTRDRLGAPLPATIGIRRAPTRGANIRPIGQDVRAGQAVVARGTALGPASIGVLAALGHSRVRVYQQPLVALFSTGDELRDVDEALEPGMIRDTNSYSLAAAARQYGARTLRLPVARDRLEQVRARFAEAAEAGAHLILSSAGVSVGAYDVVKAAVDADGALNFWRVRMRPGKPLAFGQVHGVPYFGLPGNPVSALMSFEVFVRPALLKLGGRRAWDKLEVRAELLEPMHSDGRESYLRVVVERRGDGYTARAAGDQGSAVMTSLVRANGLLILPEGTREARPGERFPVWLLDGAETGIGTGGEEP